MKKVYIYGYAVNMGSRYRACLEALGHEWMGEDAGSAQGKGDPKDADAFIIATPTVTHLDVIREASQYGKPILCEKPVSKNLVALRIAMLEARNTGVKLQMVSQYDELVHPKDDGPTFYDYFKTGRDGLYWDCIQIVGHAKGTVVIRNRSPYWTCSINGRALSIRDMDWAYVEMIRRWLMAPRDDIDRILASHEKVARLEAECLAKC